MYGEPQVPELCSLGLNLNLTTDLLIDSDKLPDLGLQTPHLYMASLVETLQYCINSQHFYGTCPVPNWAQGWTASNTAPPALTFMGPGLSWALGGALGTGRGWCLMRP